MLTEMRLEECELDCALIGKRVRTARKAKKVTQEELSEHCGCTPTHICNLENGKIGVSLELLFKISIYLDKSMDYFVMDNENANPQIKIENNIAPKLKQCDTQMLDMVGSFIDGLITYKESVLSKKINNGVCKQGNQTQSCQAQKLVSSVFSYKLLNYKED